MRLIKVRQAKRKDMAGQSDREREIFNSALERATPAERAAYLDGACGEDVEMRSRRAARLGAHDSAGGFLPMDSPTQQPRRPSTEFSLSVSKTVPA
jgi:hypothetical protein